MKPTIFPIKAFSDNYIWCLHDSHNALIVDPGDAHVVLEYLKKHHLNLKTIIITHHHYDHIDGIDALAQKYNCEIFKPNDQRIPDYQNSKIVHESDVIDINYFGITLNVLSLPGHTLSHIGYYNDELIFCGDTLFSLGCGRLFEGSPEQMLKSLTKITTLHEDTLVYCTHEYTKSNLEFSLSLLPNDPALTKAQNVISKRLNTNSISLPSTIGFEKNCNLFLRCKDSALINKLQQLVANELNDEVAVFAVLRQLKDEF